MSSSSSLDHELLEALVPQTKASSFYNSFRGIALLAELLRSDQLVDHVYHSRRHIALTFKDGKSLIVFDNVPQWAHPDKLDIPALLQSLLGDSSNIPHIFSLRYSSPIIHVQIDTSMFPFKP
jgi:hypothetical protein